MSKGQGHTGRDSGVLAWWEQRQRGEGAAWGGGASRGPCDPSFQAMSLSHVVIKQVVLNVQGVPAECPADGAPAPTGPSFLPRVLPAHRPPPRWLCLLGAGCAGGPAWRNRWREVGVPAPTLRPALRCLPEDPAGLSPPWSHDSCRHRLPVSHLTALLQAPPGLTSQVTAHRSPPSSLHLLLGVLVSDPEEHRSCWEGPRGCGRGSRPSCGLPRKGI